MKINSVLLAINILSADILKDLLLLKSHLWQDHIL